MLEGLEAVPSAAAAESPLAAAAAKAPGSFLVIPEPSVAEATAATTAGVVRIFIKDTQGTPAIRLLFEALVTAITPSATIKSAEGEFVRSDGQPLILVPAGWSLVAGTHNAESFDVVADVGGDY